MVCAVCWVVAGSLVRGKGVSSRLGGGCGGGRGGMLQGSGREEKPC